MPNILVLTLLVLAVAIGVAGAQTATQYDKLSPGNQKIVDALYDAQPTPSAAPSSGSTANSLSKDDIAAMHQEGKGWGVIFKDMKANGQLPPDVRNLGQLVSGKYQPQSGTSGSTTITTASGKSQVVGKPDAASGGVAASVEAP
ncbi:MAG: hypothetical protein HYY64_13915 [Candidatus Rokubacteria bacterium]|nr:hypothetical protein [Candidatus Rokubacteria bacterium]